MLIFLFCSVLFKSQVDKKLWSSPDVTTAFQRERERERVHNSAVRCAQLALPASLQQSIRSFGLVWLLFLACSFRGTHERGDQGSKWKQNVMRLAHSFILASAHTLLSPQRARRDGPTARRGYGWWAAANGPASHGTTPSGWGCAFRRRPSGTTPSTGADCWAATTTGEWSTFHTPLPPLCTGHCYRHDYALVPSEQKNAFYCLYCSARQPFPYPSFTGLTRVWYDVHTADQRSSVGRADTDAADGPNAAHDGSSL